LRLLPPQQHGRSCEYPSGIRGHDGPWRPDYLRQDTPPRAAQL